MKQIAVIILGLVAILASQGLMVAKDQGREDNRLDLAAAYALEGMLPDVRSILDSAPAEWRKLPPATSGRRTSEQASQDCRSLQWALLDQFLQASRKDPYDLIVAILEKHSWGGGDNPINSLVWRKLFARFAERENYLPVANYVLQAMRTYLTYDIAQDRFDTKLARQAAAAQLNEVEREIDLMLQSPNGGGQEAIVDTPANEDSIHPLLMRLLQTPRLSPFQEIPLSPQYQLLDLPPEEEQASALKALSDFSFPEGFDPTRAERQGDEAVAIGVSQDYDPVGEISRGAYWILRSHDGGKTWGAPLYTGLRIQQPYVVRLVSNAPLLAGDHLQIEVKIEELDENSITFPPIGLRAKREKSGLLLEIPFSELQRDSDGDGLTDLAEERLVLDPLNPDSDGDGVGDGWDQLPQVPWTQEADENARAFATVMGYISNGKLPGIIHEIAGPKADLDNLMRQAKKPTLTGEETIFFVARRTTFRALLPAVRTVVMMEEELELARKKFGPMFPTNVPLFFLDRVQRHGYAIWDESWRGGVLKLERTKGGAWQVTPGSQWIT